MRQTRYLIIAAIGAAVLSACGGSSGGGYPTTPTSSNPGGTTGTTPPSGSSGNTVTLAETTFQPGTLTVPAGTTVTWQWAACSDTGGYGGYATCISHSVLFDDGISSSVQSQGTFTRTFASKGTFKYHCSVHGTAMAGQVTVE